MDAHKLMEELLDEKKSLLIVDDFKDETQVDDIIPMVILDWNKDSTLLVTTCGRSAIGNHVRMNGKRLHVCKLGENAAKILFNIHSPWNEFHLSPQFNEIYDKIVEACKGMPLSLKVMGGIHMWKGKVVKLGMHIAKDEKRKKFGWGGG